MKSQAQSFAVCALLLLANDVDAQPAISGAEIHFKGSIVESSYEIAPASQLSADASITLIEVEPGVVIAVNRGTRGAGGSEPIFSTTFEALKNTPPPRDNALVNKRGVLTISYR